MNKNWIPSIFTSLNIALGTLSIIFSWQHNWTGAAIAILLAMVADAMDGRTARYFAVAGDFGKELDSLCDVVSFGVAPGILIYGFQIHALPFYLGELTAIFFAVCGALRLARFNISTTVVKGFFMGLPIPTAGCLVATYVLSGMVVPNILTAAVMILVAYMMVSEVHYPDFKGKSADKMQVKAIAVVLIVGALMLWENLGSWPFVPFFMYFLFGILNTCWNRLESKSTEQGE